MEADKGQTFHVCLCYI